MFGAGPAGRRLLVIAASWLLLFLSACAIPPQPSTKVVASVVPVASPSTTPAPSSVVGQTATVSGTGNFGLSIRKAPGLAAERIATVAEGYQASVIGGPVDQDGFQWYQLRGPDVSGWASARYLTLSSARNGSGAGSTPSPSAASATPFPLDTPLAGLLSRIGRTTNYQVGSNGIYVDPALKAAVDHLAASPTAEKLLQTAAPVYVNISVGRFASNTEGGEFSTNGHSIKIAEGMLKESLDVQSTVLAHELQHAVDILVEHQSPESSSACINLELRAFRTQEKVWLELTKPSPAATPMEHELDDLSRAVNTDSFAAQLSKLYATECGGFNKTQG